LELDRIVEIQLTRGSTPVETASFQIPLVLATHTKFADRSRVYTDFSAVEDDFDSVDKVYQIAQKLFGQTTVGARPPSIVVGRRQVDSVAGSVTVANNVQYELTIAGPASVTPSVYTFTSDGTATAAEIVTGLKAAITTAGITDPVDSGSATLILTLGASAGFTVTQQTSNLGVVLDTSTEAWGDTIDAVRNENNEWYCVSIDSRLEADFLTVAAYVEAIKATSPKLFVFSSSASNIKTSATNDIFSQMKALNYEHTAYIWKGDAAAYPECALVGRFAPEQAGSNVWEQKTLIGTTVDNLTSGEANYILGKNGSTYERVGGFDVVVGGKVAFGEWLD